MTAPPRLFFEIRFALRLMCVARAPLCVPALGTKGRTSVELEQLKSQALELYDNHPKLEDLSRQANSAAAAFDARRDDLVHEIDSLEGTCAARRVLAACSLRVCCILTLARPPAAAEIKELRRARKRGSAGGSDRPQKR